MNNFFYDLNKRLAQLASKQDAIQLAESKQTEAVAKSPLTQALNEGQAKRLPGLPITRKDVEKKFGGSMIKMAQAAKDAGFSNARIAQAMDDLKQGKNPHDVAEADYSAKKAAAGKDIGKPGKNFAKIAKGAAERYGSKAAGERVAGAVLNKLRHPKEDVTDEGNAFTGKLKATPKGEKFKMGNKTFKDTSEIEEGFKEMDAWLASREKEKGTGKFDRKERTLPGGMKATTYTRKHEDDAEDDSDAPEAKGGAPKKKGRPKGPAKGPERVTKGAWKHKGERKVKAKEGLDSDGVMMTRSTNCSSESAVPVTDRGEYDDEAGMTKDSLHTIVRHAKELERALRSNENMPEWVQEKIGQIKGMMSSVTDYILSTHERDAEQHTGREGITLVPEKAVSVAQRRAAGIAHAAQKGEIPKSKLRGASKEMAKMAKGELHKFAATKEKGLPKHVEEEGLEKHSTSALKAAASKDRNADQKSGIPANFSTAQLKAELAKRSKVEEESTDKEDQRAEKAGKKVAKDIEYDEGHKGKDDDKAEKAGKRVTKDIEYDDKKNKTKKVDEFFDQQVTVKGGDARTAGGDTSSGVSGVSSTGGSSGASNSNKNSATGGSANSNSSSKANASANANSTNEEKVEETTVAGSVAPAQNATPKGKGGMQFGKGVYEGFNNSVEKIINESMSVNVSVDDNGQKNITVTASNDDAEMLSQLLKMAGLGDGHKQEVCSGCGSADCSCETEVVDENKPDWPTNTETSDNALQYSGGLNKPKISGQTTVPVTGVQPAQQPGKGYKMREDVEALGLTLYKQLKTFKG